MPPTPLGDLLRYARRLCASQGDCDLTDGELLEMFVKNQDDAAFSFLVHRHGPMVYAVCRRVLEDALTRAAMHTGTWEGHEACLFIGDMLEAKFPATG